MSKTSQFMQDLYEIEALENALIHQLKGAELILDDLFHKREKAIRLINGQLWDGSQFLLDDLQQYLYDVRAKLQEIKPVDSVLESLISE